MPSLQSTRAAAQGLTWALPATQYPGAPRAAAARSTWKNPRPDPSHACASSSCPKRPAGTSAAPATQARRTPEPRRPWRLDVPGRRGWPPAPNQPPQHRRPDRRGRRNLSRARKPAPAAPWPAKAALTAPRPAPRPGPCGPHRATAGPSPARPGTLSSSSRPLRRRPSLLRLLEPAASRRPSRARARRARRGGPAPTSGARPPDERLGRAPRLSPSAPRLR